jgi:hypothetical protein
LGIRVDPKANLRGFDGHNFAENRRFAEGKRG